MRIAIQGEAGSNSHLAVEVLLGTQELVPCAQSAQVFQQLAEGNADAAVLPIENSLHGAVADHYDLLLEHDVAIVGETALRIRHALIGNQGVTLSHVRQVLSHPVALNQCRRFFAAHPQVEQVPFYDTAGAVKHVLAQCDPSLAALAAPAAAAVYGGTILQHDLEDDPSNFTRFFLLASSATSESIRASSRVSPVRSDRMSVAFAIPNRPGMLGEVLSAIAPVADLTRIESRPVPGKPWEYIFFADLRLTEPPAGSMVQDILADRCTLLRLLGRYGTVPATAA